jgi:hypothetical protein
MVRIVSIVLALAACSTKDSSPKPQTGSASSYLTVETYCNAFCDKLCATCGQGANCHDPCRTRCYFGRSGDKVLDGSDLKTGLALTHKELDGCLAKVATDCMAIASGQVPPECYTIQH